MNAASNVEFSWSKRSRGEWTGLAIVTVVYAIVAIVVATTVVVIVGGIVGRFDTQTPTHPEFSIGIFRVESNA